MKFMSCSNTSPWKRKSLSHYNLKIRAIKSKSVLETFLSENKPHTPSLRSGSVRRFISGEHRVLQFGEEFPFEFMLDPPREGGVSMIRKIFYGNDFMALKTLQMNVHENDFRRELAFLKNLNHIHVSSALASIKDLTERFHIILRPWCEVLSLSDGVSDVLVLA